MFYITLTLLLFMLGLYLVYGGIDLGQGILEFFVNKKLDKRHDLFVEHRQDKRSSFSHFILLSAGVGFLFSYPSAALKLIDLISIPILFAGVGLVARIFLAHPLRKKRKVNALISLWCTVWIGIIMGTILQDAFNIDQSQLSLIFSPFPIFVSIFLSAIFAYQSAVFNISSSPTRLISAKYKRRAIISNIVAVCFGFFILLMAFFLPEGITFYFLQDPISLSCLVISTLLLVPHWYLIYHDKKTWMRSITVLQMTLIFLGIVSAQFPIIFQLETDKVQLFTFNNSFSYPGSIAGSLVMLSTLGMYIMVLKQYPTWRKAK